MLTRQFQNCKDIGSLPFTNHQNEMQLSKSESFSILYSLGKAKFIKYLSMGPAIYAPVHAYNICMDRSIYIYAPISGQMSQIFKTEKK